MCILYARRFFLVFTLLLSISLASPLMPPSLLYFNSLFGAIAMTVVVRSMPGEWDRIVNFPEWRNSTFIALYLCTSFMGESEST